MAQQAVGHQAYVLCERTQTHMLIDFTSPCLTSWRAGSLPLSHTHRHNLLSNWIISHQPHRPAPCSGPKIRYVIIGSFDPNSARDEMHHFATIVIAIAYFSLLRPPILAAIHAPVQIWSS